MATNANNNDYINLADILAKAFEEALARHNATADDYKSANKQKEIIRELIKDITGSSEIPAFIGKLINDAIKQYSRDFEKIFESISKQAERAHYNRDADFIKFFYNSRTKEAFDNSKKDRDNKTRGTGASNLRGQTDKLELLVDIVKNVGTRIGKANASISKSSSELSKAADSLAINSAELEESTSWIVSAAQSIKKSSTKLGIWQKSLAINAVELEREASWSNAINRTVGKTKNSMKQSNDATLNRVTDPETDNKDREEKKSFADYLVDKLEKSNIGKGARAVIGDAVRLKSYQYAAKNANKHPYLSKAAMVVGANSDWLVPLLGAFLFSKGGAIAKLAFTGLKKAGVGVGKASKYLLSNNGLAYSMYTKGGTIGKLGENLSKKSGFIKGAGFVGSAVSVTSGINRLRADNSTSGKIFGISEIAGGVMLGMAPFLGPAAPFVAALGTTLTFLEPISKFVEGIFRWLHRDDKPKMGSDGNTYYKGQPVKTSPKLNVETPSGFTGAANINSRFSESQVRNFYNAGGHSGLLENVQKNGAYVKLSSYAGNYGTMTVNDTEFTEGVPYGLAGTQAVLMNMLNSKGWSGGSFRVTGALGGGVHAQGSGKNTSHDGGQKFDFVSSLGKSRRDQVQLAKALEDTGLFDRVKIEGNADGAGYHVDVHMKDEVYNKLKDRDEAIKKAVKGDVIKEVMKPTATYLPQTKDSFSEATESFHQGITSGNVSQK